MYVSVKVDGPIFSSLLIAKYGLFVFTVCVHMCDALSAQKRGREAGVHGLSMG